MVDHRVMMNVACPYITIFRATPLFWLIRRHNQREIFELPFWPVPMVDADQVLTEVEIVIMAGMGIDGYSRVVLINVGQNIPSKRLSLKDRDCLSQ